MDGTPDWTERTFAKLFIQLVETFEVIAMFEAF